MGIQSTETDDQNQLQVGRLSKTSHELFKPTQPDINY